VKELIKVTIASYGDGRNLMMTYRDPVTGKKVAKTSGTTNRAKAERKAGVWEDELNSGRYKPPSKVTWAEFRKKYEDEKLAEMPASTRSLYGRTLDQVEERINPDRVCKLSAGVIGDFLTTLRKSGLSDATVAKTARHLKALLNWGHRQRLVAEVPNVEMPKRQKGGKLMKGRPISGEEFDRMIAAVSKVRPKDAAAWERILNGLWLSGLRLSEAIAVSWDDDALFAVDLGGKHPRFRIDGRAQKSGKDELLPMTPDFGAWLLQTPEADRAGRVFKLVNAVTGKPYVMTEVCRVITAIGSKAGVIVSTKIKTEIREGKPTPVEVKKFASAHDLRRSFGTRWAKRVMPAVLKRLMRHADVATTMGYYVDMDCDDVAGDLWRDFGNAGNTPATLTANGGQETETRDDATASVVKG
jgi:integrase